MFGLMILCLFLNFIRASDLRQGKITKPDYYSTTLYSNRDDEIGRKFLQRYSSYNPVMFVVDSRQENHKDAANFLTTINKLRPSLRNTNFLLMRFNTSGATSVLETTKNNKRRFEELLSQEVVGEASSVLGAGHLNKSAGFFAILNAIEVLPLNSTIVIFIGRGLIDETLAQITLNTIKKNQIQIFVVWSGTYPSPRQEEKLLHELTLQSGGDFLLSPSPDLSRENYEQFLENPAEKDQIALILSRKNMHGEHNLYFPVDSGVTGLHITVTPNITRGTLVTPSGRFLDILNADEVAQYAAGSFAKLDPVTGTHEIHLNTTTASTRDIGAWRLRVAKERLFYNVTILAHTKLNADATIAFKNSTADSTKPAKQRIMKLGLTGGVSSISDISFVDKYGQEIISDKVNFTLGKDWGERLTAESTSNSQNNQKREVNIDVENIPKQPFYVVVNGKDVQGHNFTRLSYVQNSYVDKTNFQTPSLTIDVGLGSELVTQPNRQPQILFEVTNNQNKAIAVQFVCRDEQSLLLSMNPFSAWISPQETITVRVTLTTKPGSYSDLVTLTARGTDVIEKKVIVDVGRNQNINDNTQPEIDYTFTSDCTGQIFSNCESGTWVVEIKAKDTESGLLQLTSRPRGINFPNGFITGTREEVTGYYAESCCNPDLELIAVDRQNNRRTRWINAYRANLGAAAIAAIVFGVLIIILIIVAIVFICRKCFQRRKESYDLPTYRGRTR